MEINFESVFIPWVLEEGLITWMNLRSSGMRQRSNRATSMMMGDWWFVERQRWIGCVEQWQVSIDRSVLIDLDSGDCKNDKHRKHKHERTKQVRVWCMPVNRTHRQSSVHLTFGCIHKIIMSFSSNHSLALSPDSNKFSRSISDGEKNITATVLYAASADLEFHEEL